MAIPEIPEKDDGRGCICQILAEESSNLEHKHGKLYCNCHTMNTASLI